ncbi:MAG: pyridoxal-dependent decarboxylase [Candidatus Acidiferrum sp.]
MLDDILDYIKDIRDRPVWQPIPDAVRQRFRSTLPLYPASLSEVHREFMNYVLPYAAGNVHPGFMGWVHGGGTPVGMLAEMLAAGLNANLAGRDQIPIEVERQITRWMQEIFGFPDTATGLFVTGTSMANFIAVVIARDVALGKKVRTHGLAANSRRLAAYSSMEVHGCVAKAMDLCGIGSDALRLVCTDSHHRMDLVALGQAIHADRAAGITPFLIVGTAGTVNSGAIDNLAWLADLAHREKLWFHVDGAYGALAMFAPDLAPLLKGIERADSLAFDFHKWGQVPYDAGFILVRDGALHRKAFAASSSYLRRETRGLAAGSEWPCDYGPDLSRSFRALKVWFSLRVHGTQALGTAISRTCTLARYLESRIAQTADLELLAPVQLNIVCFRYRAEDADRVNSRIVVELQESGSVAPSTTVIGGRLAIRAAIVNHRTSETEIDTLLDQTLAFGRRMQKESDPADSLQATWKMELHAVEERLTSGEDSVDLLLRRAVLLSELGRFADAAKAYLKLLEDHVNDPTAINNVGSALVAMGKLTAARTIYKEAVRRHPHDATCQSNFARLLLEECERLAAHQETTEALGFRNAAQAHFEEALRIAPDSENAHEGLSHILRALGDEPRAEWHRRKAFEHRPIIHIPYRGANAPVQVLQLVSTTGGNVRLQGFLDDRIFQRFKVLPEFCTTDTPLPPHQLVINAIGDAELSLPALEAAQWFLTRTAATVINSPSAVIATNRSNNARRFKGLPGVVAPVTATVTRDQLSKYDAVDTLARLGLDFPFLLRSPGFHTGLNFLRVESFEELAPALVELPGNELLAMEYLDARGPDGKARKYRAMMIDGTIYPLHLAISDHWKIHYFTAEIADHPEHRTEDAAFLGDMPGVLGPIAMNALKRIQSVLALDYAGIDFGLNEAGEVLVFEANATMVVLPPDADARWDYRRAAYQQVFSAVQQMFLQRASIATAEAHVL